MAKAGRGQTRRDSKRRVLRPGESVRADGKYQYKYRIDGKPHFVYSWKLEHTDKLPKGKEKKTIAESIKKAEESVEAMKVARKNMLKYNSSFAEGLQVQR